MKGVFSLAINRRIIIDAGHGGIDPGAVVDGRKEKDDNLSLALEVGRLLSNAGVDVVYTRVNDSYESPLERAQIANASDADYFLSIHRNMADDPGTASGVLGLVYADEGVPAILAREINRNLEKVGYTDLGISERPGLIVLRRTEMPAVLAEVGFLDNPEDNRIFDENFNQIAGAIADGVLETIRMENEGPLYYQIQMGIFRERANAENLKNRLQAQGFPAFLIFDNGLYKVRVGAYLNLDNAARTEQQLHNYGYDTFLVREKARY